MDNWEAWFQSRILNRGFDYFMEELVIDCMMSKSFIQATVLGREPYEVEIQYNEYGILEMSCDCPHAISGQACKHMAAVLYYAEDQKLFHRKSDDKQQISQVIQAMTEDEMRQLLIRLANEQPQLRRQLQQYAPKNEEVAQNELEEYLSKIQEIFDTYPEEPDDYYSDYYEEEFLFDAYDLAEFILGLDDFLAQELQLLMKQNDEETALLLVKQIFTKLGAYEPDLEFSALVDTVQQYVALWTKLIQKCSSSRQQEVFRWLYVFLTKGDSDCYEPVVEELLAPFSDAVFFDEKIQLVDQKISEYRQATRYDIHHLDQWLEIKLSLLLASEREQELALFAEENLSYPIIRQQYAQFVYEHGNVPLAIQLLEGGKQSKSADHYLLSQYSHKLAQIYQETNNLEAYQRELWLLVTQYEPGDLQVYRQFKAVCPTEEWEEQREAIFQALNNHCNQLFVEEQLLDRLMDNLCQTPNLRHLEQYEDLLMPAFSEEILQVYQTIVESQARSTGTREHYRNIVALLRKMQTIIAGKERVAQIVAKWQVAYKNRPAMMAELKKLG